MAKLGECFTSHAKGDWITSSTELFCIAEVALIKLTALISLMKLEYKI